MDGQVTYSKTGNGGVGRPQTETDSAKIQQTVYETGDVGGIEGNIQ
jgi:hypothetical protein